MVVTDSDNRCQMMLPAGMTEDTPGSGEYTHESDKGFALLQSIEGSDLRTTVDLFVPLFSPLFTDYTETNRVATADSERIDFTGEFIFSIEGTMYFKQFGNVTCNIILFAYTDSGIPYAEILATMIDSLKPVKP
jgi:hypothetical protein